MVYSATRLIGFVKIVIYEKIVGKAVLEEKGLNKRTPDALINSIKCIKASRLKRCS